LLSLLHLTQGILASCESVKATENCLVGATGSNHAMSSVYATPWCLDHDANITAPFRFSVHRSSRWVNGATKRDDVGDRLGIIVTRRPSHLSRRQLERRHADDELWW